jgi:hypothetical protein
MTIRTWLLAGAALFALAPGAALAQASADPTVAELAAQVRLLQAQVSALTAQINARPVATATALPAPPQAIAAAPAAPAPVARAKPAVPATTVGGRMFYTLSHIDQQRDGVAQAPSGVGLDVKRFYLTVDHRFSDVFSANLTTDFQYSSALSSTQLFVKKAYLQARASDALTVRVGAADTPWVPYSEEIYGYRWIESTLTDRAKVGTSSDWGVHAFGALPGGVFSYAVAALNGGGHKNPSRSKRMDLEGRVSAKLDDFRFGLGGYSGKLGKDVEGAPALHTARRFNAMAAYAPKNFRIGVEMFTAENWNSVATIATDRSRGYSAFGSYIFTERVSAFARYDRVEPNRTAAPAREEDYFNLGVAYSPIRNVDVAVVYKRDAVENGVIATSNGAIGGVRKGTYDEVGVWGQLRF